MGPIKEVLSLPADDLNILGKGADPFFKYTFPVIWSSGSEQNGSAIILQVCRGQVLIFDVGTAAVSATMLFSISTAREGS
jgi:hypothetical protein